MDAITPSAAWTAPETPPALEPDEVHAWWVALAPPPGGLRRLAELLSPDETERAGRFRFPRDRDRYVVGRGILRLLLGHYAQRNPTALHLVYNEQGKPLLPPGETDLTFNMSHSHGVALMAFARGRALGIDLEQHERKTDIERIAERFFAPREFDELIGLPKEHRREAFFNGWTRKEAYIKAKGLGVTMGLDTFEVSLVPAAKPALLRTAGPDRPGDWSVFALAPHPDFTAALVVEGAESVVKTFRWFAEP